MSVYAEDIETAVELLEEFGAPISVDRLRAGVAVTGAPWLAELPEPLEPEEADANSFDAIGVIFGRSGREPQATYDAKAYLRPRDAANLITNRCRLTDAGGKVWRVLSADLLSPDATSVVLYTCELEQWPSL
jgi:hypothetical protein